MPSWQSSGPRLELGTSPTGFLGFARALETQNNVDFDTDKPVLFTTGKKAQRKKRPRQPQSGQLCSKASGCCAPL